jgi:hypothetical protein
LFLGGFEEDYLRATCHSRPLMVCKITGYSRKINVGFCKIKFITPQKPTVQKHTLLRYEKKSLSELIQMDTGGQFYGLKSFLNVSINKKPFFFSEVVIFGKLPLGGRSHNKVIFQ